MDKCVCSTDHPTFNLSDQISLTRFWAGICFLGKKSLVLYDFFESGTETVCSSWFFRPGLFFYTILTKWVHRGEIEFSRWEVQTNQTLWVPHKRVSTITDTSNLLLSSVLPFVPDEVSCWTYEGSSLRSPKHENKV